MTAATTAQEYRRVTDVTYLGYVHGTLAALRYMLPRDSGTIIQVSSALATNDGRYGHAGQSDDVGASWTGQGGWDGDRVHGQQRGQPGGEAHLKMYAPASERKGP